ncbi:ComEA family DNA-binding protein [Paenibacillus sp. NPDC058071]|uniref:ComEA family DNA-binding protein n=1 Tax=Paenibacillus sp. NPDC058071 TaxID=3346326 RepID=UPI0036D94E10
MKGYQTAATRRSTILPAVLLLASAVLFGAAVFLPKEAQPAGWTALNEPVAAALAEMEGGPAGGAAADIAVRKDTILEDAGRSKTEQAAVSAESVQSSSENIAQTVVPVEPQPPAEAAASASPGAEAYTDTGKLDINRATAEQLDDLKGIGPAKARAIVEDREHNGFFRSADDLRRVKGIGPKLMDGLKDSIVAKP